MHRVLSQVYMVPERAYQKEQHGNVDMRKAREGVQLVQAVTVVKNREPMLEY